MSDDLRIKRLSSGHWHIRGRGPCEWAQPPAWPCTPEELDAAFFPEASEDFRSEAHAALSEAAGE